MSGETQLDVGTQWHLDRGGSDPVTEAWSAERSRVASDPHADDWKSRANEDYENGTRAAYDEVKARSRDDEEFDEAGPLIDWVEERWGMTGDEYLRDRRQRHENYQRDPNSTREMETRWWLRQPPVPHRPKVVPKAAEPPDYLDAIGLQNWHQDNDVRRAVAEGDRAERVRANRERIRDTQAVFHEQYGLSLAQALQRGRDYDEGMHADPYGASLRYAVFSGAPATEREGLENGATAWLSSLRAQGRLPQDYDDLEPEIGNALIAMNQNGLRTGDYEADLSTAIQVARNVVNDRQQQTGTTDPQVQQWVLTAYNSLLTKGFGSDYAMQKARELVAAAYQQQRDEAAAEKARFASRSVSGSPSSGAGPAIRRRNPNMSYEDDLLADVRDAVRGA